MLQGQCTCVLEALQSNNQCVYCREVLDPQDIIDFTPQPKALSGEANVSQTTTLTELKATPEANMSGEVNVSQTTTLPELKAPPEAHMSQKKNFCQHEHSWQATCSE